MLIKKIIVFFLLVPLVAVAAKPLTTEELQTVRSPNIKVYAFEKVLDRWGDKQWSYFSDLVNRESEWTVNEEHYPNSKKSTAYGLGGFLDATWETVGCKKTSDKYTQIDCTIEYISQRYKTPQKAIQFHKKWNWY